MAHWCDYCPDYCYCDGKLETVPQPRDCDHYYSQCGAEDNFYAACAGLWVSFPVQDVGH